ncbi:MAG TPA: polymer-forming cytoskeletal protein [Candidatus Angelobacter sp.]|nr:polymer-forming cytoskeletal protein [Candidatus Angelobacter sp.]
MWKPASTTNQNPNQTQNPKPVTEPEKPVMSTTPNLSSEPTPVSAPRNAVLNNTEQATIGKSLVIKGEVTGSESLYIDGRVEGAINLPGNRVTVGRNGQVQANINAKEVVVLGKVKGNVTASDRVDIRNEGSLGGDVVCQRISIEDGAWFKGSIDIRKPGQKEMNGASKETVSMNEASRMTSATA